MTCGVYRIFCVESNRSYIGSSSNIEKRFSWHKTVLRNPSKYSWYEHPCQQDFDKFGMSKFKFEILEECSKHVIIDREQYWMDNTPDRYVQSKANGSRVCSEATRKFMSEAATERNQRPKYNSLIRERAKSQHVEGKLGWKTWKPKPRSSPPTKELLVLREYLEFKNQEVLVWKKSSSNGKFYTGEIAGSGSGRKLIILNRKSYPLDEVVWFICYGEWPSFQPTHLDGDLSNSKPSNLRVKNGEGRPRSTYPGV